MQADDPHVTRETRLRDVLALLDVLDVLDVERTQLVSHDMGAITAYHLTYDHCRADPLGGQLSVPLGFLTLRPKLLPGFCHPPPLIWHRPGASLLGVFSERYVARPMPDATVEAHLIQMQRPEIDAAVRPLLRGMVMPEAMRWREASNRRRRLTVPTLFVFGRQDHPWAENLGDVCRNLARYADRVEFAYVDDAAHFITDDAPRRSPTSRSTGSDAQRDSRLRPGQRRAPAARPRSQPSAWRRDAPPWPRPRRMMARVKKLRYRMSKTMSAVRRTGTKQRPVNQEE